MSTNRTTPGSATDEAGEASSAARLPTGSRWGTTITRWGTFALVTDPAGSGVERVLDRLEDLGVADELVTRSPERQQGVHEAVWALAEPKPHGYTHHEPAITREWTERRAIAEGSWRQLTLPSPACHSTPLGFPQRVAGGDLTAFAVSSDRLEQQ